MKDQPTPGGAPTPADGAEARTADPTTPGQAGTAAPQGQQPVPAEPPSAVVDPATSPFEGEAAVLDQGIAVRDDISATQATPSAVRAVSSAHMARLLYRPLGAPGGPVYQSQVLEERLRRG